MTLPAPTPKPAPPQPKTKPARQRLLVRWATRFWLAAPRWLPDAVRHAPLKAVSYALRMHDKGWDWSGRGGLHPHPEGAARPGGGLTAIAAALWNRSLRGTTIGRDVPLHPRSSEVTLQRRAANASVGFSSS